MFSQRSKKGSFDTWIPPPKEGIQFRLIDSVESGVESPPLWKNYPASSSSSSSSEISRIEAIIKGQKELMDMVKKMPESNYELTLKDLVVEQEQGNCHEEEKKIDDHQVQVSGRNWINGEGILENNKGLLIKMIMVFPIGIGMKKSKSSTKKKKKSLFMKSSSSSSAKISPKPDVGYTSKNGDNNGWLRNMFSGGNHCSRSNTPTTSNGISSNSSTRTGRGFYLFSCISCFKLQNDSKAPSML